MAKENLEQDEILRNIEIFFYPELPYRSLKKEYSILTDVNSEVCAECGGECCKRCGCHFSPDDFEEISFEFLKGEIEKGYISIDCVDEDIALFETTVELGTFFLRIRNQGAPIVDVGFKKTPCILLTEKGCKLDYKHRPTGGKLLIPSEEKISTYSCFMRECHSKYSIEACCFEWEPHQKVLHKLRKYFLDKEIPCSL